MAPAENEVEVLKGTLSLTTLKVNPAAVLKLPEGQNELVLARIFGNASAVDQKDDKSTGSSINFLRGTFEGVNMGKKATQRAGKLLLPPHISSVVEKAMQAAPDNAIQFAFEVRSIKNGKAWQYKAVMIKNPAPVDELAELRGTVDKYGKTAQRAA